MLSQLFATWSAYLGQHFAVEVLVYVILANVFLAVIFRLAGTVFKRAKDVWDEVWDIENAGVMIIVMIPIVMLALPFVLLLGMFKKR